MIIVLPILLCFKVMLMNHNVIVSFQSEDYTLLMINVKCWHVEIVYFVFLDYRRLSVICGCLAILMSHIQKGYFIWGGYTQLCF